MNIMNIKRILELSGKAPTIVSASTEPDGGINRKTANRMVDPKGYFQKNKDKNFGGKGSVNEFQFFRELIVENLNSVDVKKKLKSEFWHEVSKTYKFEVWQHMDDPSIGEYVLHLSPDGSIESIDYNHPLSSIFNRKFNSLGPFLKHVSETTDDNADDESMAAGAAKMRSIADELRKKR